MAQVCYLRLYLSIGTVSFRLFQRMVRMDMDWDLKKLGQLYQVVLHYAWKNNNNKTLWIVFSHDIYLPS